MEVGLRLPCLPTSFPAHSSPSFISPGVPGRSAPQQPRLEETLAFSPLLKIA